jgi:hypothetical protein
VLWEGPEALEECDDEDSDTAKPVQKKAQVQSKQKTQTPPPPLPSESEEDPSSEDEYIAEESKPKSKTGKVRIQVLSLLHLVHLNCSLSVQRPIRRLSISSESDASSEGGGKLRQKKSPATSSSRLKRKIQPTSHPPPSKKKRPTESNPADDPTRKYCLGKLEELFRDIFLRYPHVRIEIDSGKDTDDQHHLNIVHENSVDLTEDQRTALVDKSKSFADDLERCIFETYSEPDKHGKPSGGAKYK